MVKFRVLGANMKIKRIDLENVGNISNLSLSFNENMNVICGSNGIGKTTILNAITAANTLSDLKLKKKYGTSSGKISSQMTNGLVRNIVINAINPTEENQNYGMPEDVKDEAGKIINIFDNRNINYKELEAVQKYPKRDLSSIGNIQQFVQSNTVNETLKNWLVNRIMAYQGDKDNLTNSERFNIEQMLATFSIIDEKIKFKKLDYRSFELMLDDYDNEVFFEFESTGFKNILFIILGIIEEIEFRFNDMKITDFDGTILIDEVELHLHPSWQGKIIDILKKMFPKVQFIVTTHSPSVLQNLDKTEIIPLYIENTNVKIKNLELSEYGLKGWTLEEILSDVMGVTDLKNETLQKSLNKFSRALDDDDVEIAKLEYEKLNTMLHPQNPMKQIIEIQKAGLF